MRLVTLFTFIIISFESTSAHELHLSITNIDFVGDSAKISIRIIDTNQFQHFAQCYPETEVVDKKLMQQFAIDYFRKYFRIALNNNFLNLEYIETKIEEGAVWFNFIAIIPTKIEKFTVENRILTDCYNDQKNLILIKKGDFEIGLEFDNRQTKTEVILK